MCQYELPTRLDMQPIQWSLDMQRYSEYFLTTKQRCLLYILTNM